MFENNSFTVINLRGEKEPFSIKKVYHSARRSGASHRLAQQIAQKIHQVAYPGMKTREIYKKVHAFLGKQAPQSAIRFSLKEAMRKLGPTGFPFEKFIKEVLVNRGWETQINQLVPGQCIDAYEIDFISKDKQSKITFIGECKYRTAPGGRIDLELAVANYGRFLDIIKGPFNNTNQKAGYQLKSLLVTNAKFTSQAIKYSLCKGVYLLGWRYPKDQGLEYLVESQKLYPVTILPSLNKELLEICSANSLMLVKELLEHPIEELNQRLNIDTRRLIPLVKEAKLLLEN